MKNKCIAKLIFFIFALLFNFENSLLANNVEFKAKEIYTYNEGNIIVGKYDTEVFIDNGIKITADKYTYNKIKNLVIIEGKIIAKDLKNNSTIQSELVHYKIIDKEIASFGKTIIDIRNNYQIYSSDIFYKFLEKKVSSKNKAKLIDNFKNEIFTTNFEYSLVTEIIKGNKIEIIDDKKNKYFLANGMVNLKENLMVGKDITVLLKNDTFGNPKNQPRIKGNSINYKKDLTTIKKGVFTSCKKEDYCTPWKITSEEIQHDKLKQEIRYKNSWLNIYDVPVVYFPKFFHPDPTVKRKSGFLSPSFGNTSNLGSSIIVPYFYAISESSDLTFQPRIFSSNEFLIQSEYRTETKNSSNLIDFSINKTKDNTGTKNHFFSNSNIDLNLNYFDESEIFLKIERVSNDNYINMYSLESKSPILKDTEVLESVLEFSGYKNDFAFLASVEAYETMNMSNSDRYEFVYPSYAISNLLKNDISFLENYYFRSSGNQIKKQTNVYEAEQINDFNISSKNLINNFGLVKSFKLNFKNVNSSGKNSSKFKNETQYELMSQGIYDISLPLIKYDEKYINLLTPKISFSYSPNDTKNYKDDLRYLGINNVFSSNRIASNDSFEGGATSTIGLNYEKKDNNYKNIFSSSIATVFRDQIDYNLPDVSTLGNKQSDIVGNIFFTPNEKLETSYDYSISNDLDQINLHNFKNKFRINNFLHEFNFYEQNNLIGDESYYENNIQYFLNDKKSLIFKTRENKKTNLTEFYNLIYQYENDCLAASIQYNKEYYNSNSISPKEELFFSISIIPLGATQTDNLIGIKN